MNWLKRGSTDGLGGQWIAVDSGAPITFIWKANKFPVCDSPILMLYKLSPNRPNPNLTPATKQGLKAKY